jgi:hypothetical protein
MIFFKKSKSRLLIFLSTTKIFGTTKKETFLWDLTLYHLITGYISFLYAHKLGRLEVSGKMLQLYQMFRFADAKGGSEVLTGQDWKEMARLGMYGKQKQEGPPKRPLDEMTTRNKARRDQFSISAEHECRDIFEHYIRPYEEHFRKGTIGETMEVSW